ncbi:hypothetical protein X946_3069 [Burkholderia sp. ABCPW 111]|nr:hypothetical protein X946_3069 [Burkholderia sp. ABCPW 111]
MAGRSRCASRRYGRLARRIRQAIYGADANAYERRAPHARARAPADGPPMSHAIECPTQPRIDVRDGRRARSARRCAISRAPIRRGSTQAAFRLKREHVTSERVMAIVGVRAGARRVSSSRRGSGSTRAIAGFRRPAAPHSANAPSQRRNPFSFRRARAARAERGHGPACGFVDAMTLARMIVGHGDAIAQDKPVAPTIRRSEIDERRSRRERDDARAIFPSERAPKHLRSTKQPRRLLCRIVTGRLLQAQTTSERSARRLEAPPPASRRRTIARRRQAPTPGSPSAGSVPATARGGREAACRTNRR